MPLPLQQKIQNQAFKIVYWQLAGTIFISLLGALFKGKTVGFSIFLGSSAYSIANLCFVWRVFRFSHAKDMTKFLAAFYWGEVLKLLLSSFLFLMIVKYLPNSLLSVLTGFIGAIVCFWIACFLQFTNKTHTFNVA